MKKIVYIIALSIFTLGIFGCGESKTVVVGEGTTNAQYSDNKQEAQEVNEYPILESRPAPSLIKNKSGLRETLTK